MKVLDVQEIEQVSGARNWAVALGSGVVAYGVLAVFPPTTAIGVLLGVYAVNQCVNSSPFLERFGSGGSFWTGESSGGGASGGGAGGWVSGYDLIDAV